MKAALGSSSSWSEAKGTDSMNISVEMSNYNTTSRARLEASDWQPKGAVDNTSSCGFEVKLDKFKEMRITRIHIIHWQVWDSTLGKAPPMIELWSCTSPAIHCCSWSETATRLGGHLTLCKYSYILSDLVLRYLVYAQLICRGASCKPETQKSSRASCPT